MADPTPYSRGFSFTDYQTSTPQDPLPGPSVDVEFDEIAGAIDGLVDAVKDVRRSDGKLKNGIVTKDALAADFSIGFTLRGVWAAGVEYETGDGVVYNSKFYKALSSHTAANASRPDVDPATWQYLADLIGGTPLDGSITAAKLAPALLAPTPDNPVTPLATLGYVNTNPTGRLTRAALVTKTIAAAITSLATSGYATAGDGGGANYVRLGSAPSPAKAWHFQSADGAWWGLSETVVSPFMMGAKADGTNDAAAVQAACDYAFAKTVGGAVKLDAMFSLSTGITIPKLASKRARIVGLGGGLKAISGFTGILLYVGEATEVNGGWALQMEGVHFLGGGAACNALKLEWSSTSVIRDCVFENFANDMVILTNAYGPRIHGCIFFQCPKSAIHSTTPCHNTIIQGSRFLQIASTAGNAGVLVDGFTWTLSVTENSFEVGGAALLMIAGGASLTFKANHIEGLTRSPFFFAAATDSIAMEGNYFLGGTGAGTLDFTGGGWRSGRYHNNTHDSIQAAIPTNPTGDIDIGFINYGGNSNKITSPFRPIGQTGQPAFQNSWTNFNTGYRTAGFRKSMDNMVHMRGAITGGAIGSVAFTLPAGYRPAASAIFAVSCPGQAGTGNVIVDAGGQVICYPSVANQTVSLDSIRFVAEQ